MKKKLREFQKDSEVRKQNMVSLVYDKLEEAGLIEPDYNTINSYVEYNYSELEKRIETISPTDLHSDYILFAKRRELSESVNRILEKTILKEEEVEQVDIPSLIQDVAGLVSTVSDSLSIVSNYRQQYISNENLKASLDSVSTDLSDLLTKLTGILKFLSK